MSDPFAPHLQRAQSLYEEGEVLQAGQIWQAILKRQPDHAAARTGLLKVKAWLEAQKAPPPTAPPPKADPNLQGTQAFQPPTAAKAGIYGEVPADTRSSRPALDPDWASRLLREGCNLYDMGQLESALGRWEEILRQDPGHRLAQDYIRQTRRELGLDTPVGQAPAAGAEIRAGAPPDVREMLRRATQLYEIGSLEEAISALERVVEVEPRHGEAAALLRVARLELEHATRPAPPPPVVVEPPRAPEPAPRASWPPGGNPKATWPPASRAGREVHEQKLLQAERLLQIGRYEEAGFAFEMILAQDPTLERAQEGLEQARRRSAHAAAPAPPTLPPATPAVVPPAALQTPATPLRTAPELPRSFQELGVHPLLDSTRVLVTGLVLVAIFGGGISVLQARNRDKRLRSSVASARESAVAPVARNARPLDLAEGSPAIRSEADACLVIDPVRSYHRAKELLRRDPGDPVAASLLEKARAALTADPVPGVSLTEAQRLVASGDLDGADRTLDALLRARPEDPDLMGRATRLQAVIAGLHASQGEWNEARTALQRARAFYPQDRSWQARLKLLERIQAMPKEERGSWIPFLG